MIPDSPLRIRLLNKRMKSSLNLTKILQNATVQEQECTEQEKER